MTPQTNPPTKLLDPTDLTYTVQGFEAQGNPVVTFHCDGHTAVCGSCPKDNLARAKAYLTNYARAYIAGMRMAQGIVPAAAANLQDIIGKVQKPEG